MIRSRRRMVYDPCSMRTSRLAGYLLLSLGLASVARHVRADAGDNASALPAIVRIGVPSAEQRPLALAATAGYGVTESQNGEGAHHRANGALAASIGATRFLAFGLRLDGRYDSHPSDRMGSDGGWVGDPRAYARAGVALSDSLRFGGELVAWLPGDSAPSLVLKAATLDFTALLAWSNRNGLVLATRAGFRWDNSGSSAPSYARLRAGDRLALGVSDFDALLLGLGASQRLDAFEIVAELSADALIGSGAPSFTRSPLRASAGARYYAISALACELVLDTSLSGRPSLAASAFRVPIEPRFSVQLGIRYAFGSGAKAQTPATSAAPRRAERAEALPTPAAATASLRGKVVDQDGEAVEGARVELRIGETTRETQSAADGSYELTDVPLGSGRLAVHGEGLEDSEQAVDIGAAAGAGVLELQVQRAQIGQIRGLVRSFAGAGLAARIEVPQLKLRVQADADGKFELNLPPGQYKLSIEMAGYTGQHRTVSVETRGVTLLNVELRERKP
jgi:hypothetical protein